MEEWVTMNRIFPTEDKALKAAGIIRITESRLLSVPRGPQYDIEVGVDKVADGWQVRWRKVLTGYDSGCSGCGSCNNVTDESGKQKQEPGKVLKFRPKQV